MWKTDYILGLIYAEKCFRVLNFIIININNVYYCIVIRIIRSAVNTFKGKIVAHLLYRAEIWGMDKLNYWSSHTTIAAWSVLRHLTTGMYLRSLQHPGIIWLPFANSVRKSDLFNNCVISLKTGKKKVKIGHDSLLSDGSSIPSCNCKSGTNNFIA